ncbi:UDP-2,3-diacylglucosamine hydrolase [uncultured Caudovirales phage]|uniref:UDP-2,3-diacylglucosamine hydrolase n=1 Tax=uncultured Caudovirales phage TaxID=2100421 RepID=A0A6J5NZB3_9CAUD|nr:UDP-2,3-diacylglucosamine hydrolase [uncultured Caudovirales phage]
MNSYKTVFISDIHLGARMSQADKLLDFFKTFECEKMYLVGDIIDCWAMRGKSYWPQHHNDVVQKLLRRARKGTEIIYIPGNHDEFMREYCDAEFGHILLQRESVHVGVDSKIYYVTHGDQFDVVTTNAKWLAHLGSWAYDISIMISLGLNKIRHTLGMPYWSLSSYLKQTVKESVNFIGNYEETLSDYVNRKGYDGIICGHIHHANIRKIGNMTYINCGDWVESMTAVVEHHDGRFELIEWSKK